MNEATQVRQLPVRTTLLALAIGAFAIGSDAFVAIGVVNEIARDLNISVSVAGQLVTVFALCYAIFAPIAATLLAGACRKKVMLATMLLFSVGNIVCAVADSVTGIFLGRIIAAMGAAAFTPQATAVASLLVAPERRGAALAVVFGGMTVAGAVGAPLGTYIGQTAGWRIAFIAIAVLGVASFALLSFLLRPSRDDAPKGLLDVLQPARNRDVLVALSVTFLVVLSEYVVYSYISLILTDGKFAGVSVLPTALFLFGIGAMLGNVATAVLTDRFGPRGVLLGTVFCQTICMALVVLYRDKAGVVLPCAFAWGVFSYMYLVPIQHRLLDLSKRFGAFTLSLNSSVIYLGIAAGGALGGLVVARFSLETLTIVSIAASLAALKIAHLSFPRSSGATDMPAEVQ
jgi:predicted MFS family arabinose efflux permease